MKKYCGMVLLVAVTFAIMLSGAGLACAEQSDQAAIEKVLQDFSVAFTSADIAAVNRLVDDHAVWLMPGRSAITGKDRVLELYAEYFQLFDTRINMQADDVQVCGDWAFLHGAFIRSDTPKSGGAALDTSGNFLLVLKRQADGAWKIARDIWNDAPPASHE